MNCSATRNGQNGKMEGQRCVTSELSTGLEQAFIALQPTCPFVREATLLPDTPAAMGQVKPPNVHLASRVSSSLPSDWRNIHPHQPLPRDPSCHLFCAKTCHLTKTHLNLL